MKYTLVLCALGLIATSDAFKLKQHVLNRQDNGEDDSTNVQVANIYGIPSDAEKNAMKAKEMAKKKKQLDENMRKQYTQSLMQFSKTLKESDFDNAMKQKQELLD